MQQFGRRSGNGIPPCHPRSSSQPSDFFFFSLDNSLFKEYVNNNNSGESENESDGNAGVPGKSRHCRSASVDSLIMMKQAAEEFTSAELEKIRANEMLAELALADPKRVKRILANRQSAARSKQRKMHYIAELESKVQTLQTEATTLSAQLTVLQRDSAGLSSQNNELKIRLQAMQQQARLKDALNEALNAEVQRLKIAKGEATGVHLSSISSR